MSTIPIGSTDNWLNCKCNELTRPNVLKKLSGIDLSLFLVKSASRTPSHRDPVNTGGGKSVRLSWFNFKNLPSLINSSTGSTPDADAVAPSSSSYSNS